MSLHISEEPRIQDIIDAVRVPYKCRIPQRLHSERQSGPPYRNKVNNTDVMFRTKSTSRAATDKETPSQTHEVPRSIRSCRERNSTVSKKPPATPKRVAIDNNQKSKTGRPVITVPVQQKTIKTLYPSKNCRMLPDQKTINQYEELEMQRSDLSNDAFEYVDLTERDVIKPEKEQIGDISSERQMKINEFQRMKIELKSRQKIVAADHSVDITSTDDFGLNAAKMPTDQLFKLRADSKFQSTHGSTSSKNSGLAIDVKKFYNIPSKLVATCERALTKRQEIIDWLDSLKTKISNISLTKKITEFNSDNEMLRAILHDVKNEFRKELQEIEHYIRQRVNDTVAMHLQAENMTYKLSELNAQNADLRKQLCSAENSRSHSNRNKILELEKELKEKQKTLKDRLSKTEEQCKIATERASQLEAILEEVNSKLETKETITIKLQEQNQKLQRKYDEELKRLNESVEENTTNLEKIAYDRDQLQTEKDDLEKQLKQLSQYYNESLNNNNMEMKLNIAKLAETETKYNIEIEEKNKLKSHYCEQLLEAEMRNKELENKLQEIETQLSNKMVLEYEHKNIKDEIERVYLENKNYKNLLLQQTETLKEIEQSFEESREENKNLNQNLEKQKNYIFELQNQEELLKAQLQNSEAKIESYEHKLMELKDNFLQMQQQQIDGLNKIKSLQDTITKQEAGLVEANLQNNKLSESIEKKQIELMKLLETNKLQELNLREKDNVIKSLSNVEEDQSNIIKQLRNDIEYRANADAELNRQLERKNFEINTLSNNLDIRNEQILQLEKIILTLEENARKTNLQRKKYEDTIHLLEMKIKIYESNYYKQGVEATSRNLDHFLKLLEDEIANPTESNDIHSLIYTEGNRKITDESKNNDEFNEHKCYERQLQNLSKQKKSSTENYSNKNSAKTAYFSSSEELYKGDNLKHSKVNEDESNSYLNNEDQIIESKRKPNETNSRERILAKNLHKLTLNKYQIEKKSKMFALAGHRL